MQSTIQIVAKSTPLIFGFAFLSPLLIQILEALTFTPPFGLSKTTLGLMIGGSWGIFAQIRGRWI